MIITILIIMIENSLNEICSRLFTLVCRYFFKALSQLRKEELHCTLTKLYTHAQACDTFVRGKCGVSLQVTINNEKVLI